MTPSQTLSLVNIAHDLHAAVVKPGKTPIQVQNLGWLLKNWKQVESFEIVREGSKTVLIALLKLNTFYVTEFADYNILLGFLQRPIFYGLTLKEGPSVTKIERVGTLRGAQRLASQWGSTTSKKAEIVTPEFIKHMQFAIAALRLADDRLKAAMEAAVTEDERTSIARLAATIDHARESTGPWLKNNLSVPQIVPITALYSRMRAAH